MSAEREHDPQYVDAWILNEESGRDVLRIRHIDPYLKSCVQAWPDDSNILDVGCGWGKILECLKPTQRYTGLDPHPGFLEYVGRTYPRADLTLLEGALPRDLPVPNEAYDAVMCSMVLHCIADVRESVDALFAKAKHGADIRIITFAEGCTQALIHSATRVDALDETHLHGMVRLSSGYEVETDVYFHPEAVIEECIATHGAWVKRELSAFFVAYECRKQEQ